MPTSKYPNGEIHEKIAPNWSEIKLKQEDFRLYQCQKTIHL